ncbi:MAG: type I DNA topoisomerase [Actinomycetes bacterium]
MATKARTAGGGSGALRRLVIVESPAKAKTIAGYLGPGYVVDSSVGHIRDLPHGAAEIPDRYKALPWSNLAVDIENDFTPIYVVHPSKRSKVAELKAKLAQADELLLATDEDREGEAIAWHLLEVLKPKVPVKRMVFHEITKEAIQRAARETRDLDRSLVDAQETRRVLDRLYGYEVSPVLWRKIMQGLSAGRVQSVALRLVGDRERERIAFTAADYWGLEALVDPGRFRARLTSIDGRRVANGSDFGDDGQLKNQQAVCLDEANAVALAAALEGASLLVASVERKPSTRRPAAPFMTSTLQQEAGRKLRWNAQRAMRVAQGLYERGYITYMRTDSTTLSDSALRAAREQAADLYGADHVAAAPRRYERKVKNAQEAHEAIRPAGDVFRTPAEVAGELHGDEFVLYDLIWKRTIASQMADAKVATTTIKLRADARDGRTVEFSASGTVVTFPGFLAAYEEGSDEEDGRDGKKETKLPLLAEGDVADLLELSADGHVTKAPARYTEASLVKQLEERGIGRPSTYAAIMGTLVDRGYVNKRGTALVPTWLGFAVVRLLEEHFTALVDYDFTATMEETLDTVAAGDVARVEVLRRFYFGGTDAGGIDFPGLQKLVNGLGEIDARGISSFPIKDSDCVLRVGRYGPYLDLNGQRANVPADLAPDELTAQRAQELMEAPSADRDLGEDPETGNMIIAKSGRYGPYVTEVLPDEPEAPVDPDKPRKRAKAKPKPRTASLFTDMSLEGITLEDALKLLTLPRIVGLHPDDQEPIEARNGRYGPYITHGKESRSLPDEPTLFTVTLPEAVEILAQPKQRRGRGQADPGTEVGEDPATKTMIMLKDGRFGPYVTDGTTNASLRRSDDPQTITLERAAELLADRRAAGPPVKKATARKAPAKKAVARKTVAKKTVAKKAPAKRPAAKKAPTG